MNSVRGELQRFKAEFFRALAHPTRIRLLEVLLEGERSVQELQDILDVEQPVVSQQLAVLRAKEIARRIFNNRLVGTQGLLRELKRQERRRTP
jgi:DNA-binding transcriptional ArsR family regulator